MHIILEQNYDDIAINLVTFVYWIKTIVHNNEEEEEHDSINMRGVAW